MLPLIPLLAGGLSSLINSGSSAFSQVQSSVNGSNFMNQMNNVQQKMQQDMVEKAWLDAQNNKINGIADSASKAGSAAAQVKIQY